MDATTATITMPNLTLPFEKITASAAAGLAEVGEASLVVSEVLERLHR